MATELKVDLAMIRQIDFEEKIGSKDPWCNWGQKNLFPETIIQFLYNSALHHNICEKRAQMICGDGITINKTSNKNLQLTEKFLASVNHYGESMDELMVKLALDYVVFNSAALEVRWGRGLNRIVELIHIPMDTIRIGLKDRLGNIDAYYYSDNWKLCRRDEYKPIPVTPFSPIPDIIKVDPNQVMLMNRYSPGSKYYSLPDYVGGLNYINLDYQMSEFATSHVKNGFFPNVIITVRNMSDEAKEFITSEFEKSQQGPANSGKPVWIFPEGDGEVKIDSLTVQQFDKLIETFDALATKNILQAHGINGILAGIAESGKLGESDEINNAYLIYQADKIIPAQNAILSRLNKILKINQLDEIKISSSTPIPFTCNEETMKSVLTVNELRDELGFGELTTEEYVNIVDNVSGKGAKGNEAGQTPPEATTTPKPKRTIPPKQV